MSGFYVLQRGWQENPAFNNEPFSRRDAWVWLIETANYAEGGWGVAGRTITLKRGQLCRPLRKIAEAWKWDEAKVRRFLDRLEADAMIARVTDAKSTVITICNYDEYQLGSRVGDAANDANSTHRRRIGNARKKEGDEGKEDSPCSPPLGDSSPEGEHANRDLLGDDPATKPRPKRSAGAGRGTRVPEGDLPDEWAVAANHTRERHELPLLSKSVLRLRWEGFTNYWRGVSGSKGLKADWRATWVNNCIDPRTEMRFPPQNSQGKADAPKPQPSIDDWEAKWGIKV